MFHHGVGLLLKGELHAVKLPKKLNRVLDLGTGTSIWAIDMAEWVHKHQVHANKQRSQHPEATVIGVDLSPIQPSWHALPNSTCNLAHWF